MPETILAFDYGRRRIGVAVGQDVTASASPVGTVANGEAVRRAVLRDVRHFSDGAFSDDASVLVIRAT